MSEFWDLFVETGEIGFYLMYLESNENNVSSEKQEPPETDCTSS